MGGRVASGKGERAGTGVVGGGDVGAGYVNREKFVNAVAAVLERDDRLGQHVIGGGVYLKRHRKGSSPDGLIHRLGYVADRVAVAVGEDGRGLQAHVGTGIL